MITFIQTVEEAAKEENLARILHLTLTAFNDKQKAIEEMKGPDEYMMIEARFIAQCEANIQAIDYVLNRKANELARSKRLCLAS